MSTISSRPNLLLIDILRGAAALAVLLYHISMVAFFPDGSHAFFSGNAIVYLKEIGFLKSALYFIFGFGFLGVPLFFVISGFCIHLPYVNPNEFDLRGGTKSYLLRRFWRLYPVYIILTCGVFVLCGAILQKQLDYNINIRNLFDHLFFWYYSPESPKSEGIIGVSWTIALEVSFYLIYLIIGRKLITNFGIAKVTVTWFLIHCVYTLLIYNISIENNLIHPIFTPSRFPITRFAEWLLGAWIAEWWVKRRCDGKTATRDNTTPRMWIYSGLSVFCIMITVGGLFEINRDYCCDALAAIGFAFLIRGLIVVDFSFTNSISKFIIIIGTFSYSLYMIHSPVIAGLKLVFMPYANNLSARNFIWAVFAIVVSIVLAWIIYILLEKPSHQLGKNGNFQIKLTKYISFRIGRNSASILLICIVLGTGWVSTFGSRKIVSFTTPNDTRFIQISALGYTTVLLQGRSGIFVDQIEWLSERTDISKQASRTWEYLDRPNRITGSFSGKIDLGPGHHVIWVRTVSSGKHWLSKPVQVFVGDVFMVMGQSNALGQSILPNSTRAPIARLIDQDDFSSNLLIDPQSVEGGGSPWPHCGTELAKELGYPIGFINAAQGGISIKSIATSEWIAKKIGDLQDTQSIRGIIWCQGEADYQMTYDDYTQHLRMLIEKINDLKIFVKKPVWVISTSSWNGVKTTEQIRSAQQDIINDFDHAYNGPDTDILLGDYRDPDHVHFSDSGNEILSREWSISILNALRD